MELASCRATPTAAAQALVGLGHQARCAWLLPASAVAAARRGRRAAGRGERLAAPRAEGTGTSSQAATSSSSSNGLANGTAQQGAAERTIDLGQREQAPQVWTKFVAETLLPTRQGKFRLRGYRHTVDGGRTYTEPSVIISGNPEGLEGVPVRVHDACFTSEVLGSLKCDCREQLELALDYIRDHPPGMVIYLQQEGRGIGLANKIAAYALQEKGLDTVDANRALGLPDDCREYSAVQAILEEMGIKSIQLMTNNPRKITELGGLGIPITGRIPCLVQAQKYNAGYLGAKHKRMAHILNPALFSSTDEGDLLASEPLEGQFCFWEHEGEPTSAGIAMESPVPLPDGLDSASSSISTSSADGGSGSELEPGACGTGTSADAA